MDSDKSEQDGGYGMDWWLGTVSVNKLDSEK